MTYKECHELHVEIRTGSRFCYLLYPPEAALQHFVLASHVFRILSATLRFASLVNRLNNFYHRLQAELEEAREEARIKAQEEIVVRIQEAKVIIVTLEYFVRTHHFRS